MKRRKFSEGGFEGENYGEDGRPAATEASEVTKLMPEKPKSFKEAFAESRSAGDKIFTWQGKKYTTELAGTKPSTSPNKQPATAPTSTLGNEFSERSKGYLDARRQNVEPAEQIPGAGAYKAPASTGQEAYSETGRNVMNTLSALGAGGSGALLGAGIRAANYPARMAAKEAAEVAAAAKRGAASRAAIQAKRAETKRKAGVAKAMEEAKPILQARPGKAPVKAKARYNQDEAGVEFKHGGKTHAYAKGGSVRGDGCAQRGKTKGRMV